MTDAKATPDWVFVPCEACETEGRIYHGQIEDEWSEPCRKGSGMEPVAAEPVEMEDLDNGRC
jgi:hypothetical protein